MGKGPDNYSKYAFPYEVPTFRTQYHAEVLAAQWALTLLSIDALHAFIMKSVENLLSNYRKLNSVEF